MSNPSYGPIHTLNAATTALRFSASRVMFATASGSIPCSLGSPIPSHGSSSALKYSENYSVFVSQQGNQLSVISLRVLVGRLRTYEVDARR